MRRAVALLLLAVLLPRQLEAARSDAVPEETRSLAGQLLVAEPGLGDPNFSHTVVLMVQHDGQGAGW